MVALTLRWIDGDGNDIREDTSKVSPFTLSEYPCRFDDCNATDDRALAYSDCPRASNGDGKASRAMYAAEAVGLEGTRISGRREERVVRPVRELVAIVARCELELELVPGPGG